MEGKIDKGIDEAIEDLRVFLVNDIEAGDYSTEYINTHIEVCKKQIEKVRKNE